MTPFALRSRRIVTPDRILDGAVVVKDGRIEDVVAGDLAAALPAIDVGANALLPAVVDCHAHVNEPGRTEWEGFATATRAAAAGGIGTVVDMPLNSIPATTSVEALRHKRETASGRCQVDYGFWGGVVPGNAHELAPMVRAGALGFKAFLCPSGVDEFPHASRADLERAMPILAGLGVPLLVHAELESPAAAGGQGGDARAYASYLRSRPPAFEDDAISLMVDLCRTFRCRVHIVHLSSASALPLIRRAKDEGLPLTVETCPHYLSFAAEEIPDGATHFKCAPPIREAANRERLWEAVEDGTIDFVVSDHSPCTPALKKREAGDFLGAWGGISSIQFSLPAVWAGMRRRGLGLLGLARAMCEGPARFIGQGQVRGRIARGLSADFAVVDPDRPFTPAPAQVLHRHPLTPYAGVELRGRVLQTWLRGERIYDGGAFPAPARGRPLVKE